MYIKYSQLIFTNTVIVIVFIHIREKLSAQPNMTSKKHH